MCKAKREYKGRKPITEEGIRGMEALIKFHEEKARKAGKYKGKDAEESNKKHMELVKTLKERLNARKKAGIIPVQ